MKTCCTKK